MSNLFLILSTLLLNHEVLSQLIRQPELSRPFIESLLDSRQFLQEPGYAQIDYANIPIPNGPTPNLPMPNGPLNIADFTINLPNPGINLPNPGINLPNPGMNLPNPGINLPNPVSSNLINFPSLNSPLVNDPSVCKNLANTIQLMVVSDILKSREGGDEIALRLAAPVLSELLSAPVRRSSSRSNVLGSNLVRAVPTSNYIIPSNVVIPSSVVSPRIVNSVTPNIMSSVSNGKIDRGLLTSLLKLLGGAL